MPRELKVGDDEQEKNDSEGQRDQSLGGELAQCEGVGCGKEASDSWSLRGRPLVVTYTLRSCHEDGELRCDGQQSQCVAGCLENPGPSISALGNKEVQMQPQQQ